jgi:hypothetical protein
MAKVDKDLVEIEREKQEGTHKKKQKASETAAERKHREANEYGFLIYPY